MVRRAESSPSISEEGAGGDREMGTAGGARWCWSLSFAESPVGMGRSQSIFFFWILEERVSPVTAGPPQDALGMVGFRR